MFAFSKKARRDALRAQPTSEQWRAIVDSNVPYAALLEADDRHELEALMRIFLAEKRFAGCGGLSITDEMRITIAAQACLLLLHRQTDVYPDLETILVYPHPYRARDERRVGPVVVEGYGARLGESWTRGVLVLAWDHVNATTHPAAEGHNLVLHEFAHQLDAEDGAMDGAPPVGGRARYVQWARVLGDEYNDLSKRLRDGRASDVDPYGATSPAEFFAVVTEMFFERPRQEPSRSVRRAVHVLPARSCGTAPATGRPARSVARRRNRCRSETRRSHASQTATRTGMRTSARLLQRPNDVRTTTSRPRSPFEPGRTAGTAARSWARASRAPWASGSPPGPDTGRRESASPRWSRRPIASGAGPVGPNDDAVRVNLGRELNDLAHRVARAQMNAYGDPAQAVHQGGLFVDVEAKVLMSSLDRSADGCVWELAVQQDEIGDHRQPILTYARSRLRSDQAAQILRGIGFHDVFSMGTLTGAERQATGRLV